MKPKEIREMSIKDLRERIETEKANLAQMNRKGHRPYAHHPDRKGKTG